MLSKISLPNQLWNERYCIPTSLPVSSDLLEPKLLQPYRIILNFEPNKTCLGLFYAPIAIFLSFYKHISWQNLKWQILIKIAPSIIYIEKKQGSFLSRLQISKYNAILKTFYKISQLDTFLLSFDFPVMGCPWSTCNALIVTGFKLLSIPNLDKVREQLTWRLWWKIREKHVFLFLQPGRKLIILREIVITGQLLKLVCLKKKKTLT